MAKNSGFGGRLSKEIKVPIESVPGQDQWWQVLERAFWELTKTEEGRALYGDPERGATLPQAWRASFLLGGIDFMCLAVDSLPEEATNGITRLARFPRDQVVDLLTQVFTKADAVSVYESDGRTGHTITVLGWDPERSRFTYHDPWPGDSLLAAANNIAGVAATEEQDGDWSISRDELAKVVQAAFLFPSTWADLTGNPSQQPYAELQKSEFFSFFNIQEVASRPLGTSTEISLKTGGFQEHVDLTVWTNVNQRVSEATLQLRESWVIGPPMGVNPFAVDIARSFLLALAPPQNRGEIQRLAETLSSLHDLEAMRPTLQDPAFAETDEGRLIAAYIGNASFFLTLTYCTIGVETELREDQPWIGMTITLG